jgi:hypothetical protein
MAASEWVAGIGGMNVLQTDSGAGIGFKAAGG